MKKFLIAVFVAAGMLAGGTEAQPVPNTLGKIKAARAINVGFSGDSLPFSFVGSNNEPAGYSIDICKRVIAHIGRAIGEPNLKVNWKVGSVVDRLQMVASGKADIECANTTQTLSRLANVDFSNLIFVDGGGFLVKSDSPVNRMSELGGRKIAVLQGTTTESRLKDSLARQKVVATIVPIAHANEGVAMLESGSVDAYAGDKIKLVGLAAQAKDPGKLALLAEDLSIEPYAFALPRNDSALRLEVNRALTQVYMGGEIETIFANWLGKLGRPSGLLAAMYLLYSIPD
ncbi:MAG: amino acid ABC transporter substrate-binding protein [Burkholderiales bacterium]|nr:amino acid ABC transporter substrate-binding protein [Burkholderiales bacterium]